MMHEAPCLECENFCFYYGKSMILSHINFNISLGTRLAIIGSNGSGKSTLLKNFLSLTEGGKHRGRLAVMGRPIEDWQQRELAQVLAYVPQAGGRIPPFTVRDFVNLSRYPFGYHAFAKEKSFDENVNFALDLTNTAHLSDRRLDALSGGQRQRAYLAAALAQNTPILLLDEPASFLDPSHTHAMNETLKKLHAERNVTIITVTHDLSLPLDTGGKVLALKNGKQVFFGDAEHLAKGEGILEKIFDHQFSYLRHPRTHKLLVVD